MFEESQAKEQHHLMITIPNFSKSQLHTEGLIVTEKISMANIANRQLPTIKVDVQQSDSDLRRICKERPLQTEAPV